MSNIIKFNPEDDATVHTDAHYQKRGDEKEKADAGERSFSDEDFAEERTWIDRIRSNPEDFWYFYDKYYDSIYRFLLRRTQDIDVAQDLTADTFTKALDKFWQYRWQGRPFVAWLLRIASNEANLHDRKKKRRPTDFLEDVDAGGERIADVGDTPEETVMKAIEDEALLKGLERLDPQCRTWLTLHYMERLTTPQIAEIEGVKEGTMKARISRCLDKLREIMR